MPSCDFKYDPNCICKNCKDPDEREKLMENIIVTVEDDNPFKQLEQKAKEIQKYKNLLKNAMEEYKKINDKLSKEFLDA